MSYAIECQDLCVSYRSKGRGPIEAVRGLSFHVQPGEIVGFLGPNGAGKSSTLKALMGFVQPDSGSCRIFDQAAGTPAALRRVGYLPEVALYYPFLTPLETLRLYGELQGLSGQSLVNEARGLLELVGLKDVERKQNRALSKGMLQRVGIAQSLLGSPDLLILDEVTSGLDPIGRRELRELLLERNRQGATLFFSSHELSEVSQICDRLFFIDQGRLIEERLMGDLREELRNFTIAFHGAVSLLDISQDFEELPCGAMQARFRTKTELIEAIDRVRDAGGMLIDVTADEGSLETYFVDTIQGAA